MLRRSLMESIFIVLRAGGLWTFQNILLLQTAVTDVTPHRQRNLRSSFKVPRTVFSRFASFLCPSPAGQMRQVLD